MPSASAAAPKPSWSAMAAKMASCFNVTPIEVRPHTAASVEKAAADAIALFHALRQAPSADTALHAWEQLRLAEGAAIYCQGISLGTSGFGSGSSSYGHALYSGTFPC